MSKVLITGAGGFTGRYLAAALANAGYDVYGTFSTAKEAVPPGLKAAIGCDLLDSERMAQVLQEVQPDFVAHLAAISFVAHGDVQAIYRTNVLGTRSLLEAIAGMRSPPRMTLLASSANIYGNATVDCIDESTPPAPANDYAVSKLAMEYVARLYADRIPLVTARPFNYTGVGQADNFLVPKIVSHVRRRAAAIELGNIDVSRDFSDVRTVVEYYHRLLECPDAAGKTLNVCSGRVHSLREILTMAQEISGHEMEIKVNPAFVRASDVKVLKGSNQRLTALVGQAPAVPLKDTLRWMIEAP